jgi:hypothetical protein
MQREETAKDWHEKAKSANAECPTLTVLVRDWRPYENNPLLIIDEHDDGSATVEYCEADLATANDLEYIGNKQKADSQLERLQGMRK